MKSTKWLFFICLIGAATIIGLFFASTDLGNALYNHCKFLFNEKVLQLVGGIILILLLVSIYIEYALKDKIHMLKCANEQTEDKKTNHEISRLEKNLHYHFSYSHIAVFVITLIGLLFSGYSDAFYQQGGFIGPVIKGLNDNAETFDISKLDTAINDTIKLVFVIDVSGSIKGSKKNIDRSWIKKAINFIDSQPLFKNSSGRYNLIKDINEDSTLGIVKLKMCYLLLKERENLKNNKRKYSLSLFSFGRNTDVNIINEDDLNKDSAFESLIDAIIQIRVDKEQASQTNYELLIEKVNHFINPRFDKDGFTRPTTIISIFSDFINDSPEQDTNNLIKLVTNICNTSTYFNLFFLEPKDSTVLTNKLQLLPQFNNQLFPDYINLQNLNADLDLRSAVFKSPDCMKFIIDKPFRADTSRVFLKLSSRNSVILKLIKKRPDENEWQQFKLNKHLLLYKTPDTLQEKGNYELTFFGHVPELFSNTEAQFEFPDTKETITTEIIFLKGINKYIARIFFTSGFLIFLISFLYIFYLVYFFLFATGKKILKANSVTFFSRKQSRVENESGKIETTTTTVITAQDPIPLEQVIKPLEEKSDEYTLEKDEIMDEYLVPCFIDNIAFNAFIRDNNTIPFAIADAILKTGKWKDQSVIIDQPFQKQIDTKKQAKLKVKIFNSRTKGDVAFSFADNTRFFTISKSLIRSLGFDDDIRDGKLKRL